MVMGKQGTILVVDDENGIRHSFKVLFKGCYHVLAAETGKEAIDLLTKNSVDLILLDILLPDVNGLDLLEKLKAIDPNLDVIMVTAVKDVQTAVKAIKLGAYEYIIKPFLVDDVLNAVERALEKRSLLRGMGQYIGGFLSLLLFKEEAAVVCIKEKWNLQISKILSYGIHLVIILLLLLLIF